MTSGTITTDPSLPNTRRRSQRGKLILLAVLVVAAVVLLGRNLRYVPAYQEWHYARAPLTDLQTEAKSQADNPRLMYHIGLRLNQEKRYIEADGYLRTAVGLDPDDPQLRDAWAEALLKTGRITAAFGQLSQFVGTHPNSAQGHLMLGKFYLSQESMERAAEELTRAVTLDPNQAEGWTALAAAQSVSHSTAQAIQSAERAAALRPQDSSVQFGLAILMLNNGQVERARQVFAQAVKLAPQSANAHREYARSLLDGTSSPATLQQAEAEARQAVKLSPDDLAASLILGRILLAQSKPAEAVPFLQRTAEASPFDHPSAFAMMQAYTQLKQPEQAAKWQQIFRRRFERTTAKQKLVTAIQQKSKPAEAHKKMAKLLAEEGNIDGCLRHNAEALHCAPDAPPALIAAANHLRAAGFADKALPVVLRAIEEAPNNPLAQESLGDIWLAMGQPHDAAKAYARASRGFPTRLNAYQKKLDDEYARRHPGYQPKPLPTNPNAAQSAGK